MSKNKQELFSQLKLKIDKEISNLKNTLKEVEEGFRESPGRMQSRYDSARAEYAREKSELKIKLEELEKKLKNLNNLLEENKESEEKVSLWSLVECVFDNKDSKKKLYLIVDVGMGEELELKEKGIVIAISQNSPIGNVLLGKKNGDKIVFMDKTITISNIE